MSHFLQGVAWEQFQRALGNKTIRRHTDTWDYLGIIERNRLNSRLYVPYGPSFQTMADFDTALTSLRHDAKVEHLSFIRIEPSRALSSADLRARGFHPVNYQQLQPTHTQIIDLTNDEETLLQQMSQSTRNIVRNYYKKGITIRKSTDPSDITILTGLLASVASRNHITVHTDTYFQQQAATLFPLGAAALYIAEYNNTPIAAALAFEDKTTRTYAHAAANDSYRKLNAGTALLGYMILDAKKSGLTTFDLYGIADTDDPRHPWAGFTKFKKSFGGHSVAYPGAWDLPLNQPVYWLYRLYQSVRSKLRR